MAHFSPRTLLCCTATSGLASGFLQEEQLKLRLQGAGLRAGTAHASERMLLNLHFLILIIFYDATADY
jgi:hypothetical protein